MIQHTVQAQFLHAFQQFCRTDPGLHLLAALCRSACKDCAAVQGWTKGGCLVAARGIQRYIANSLKDTAADLLTSLVAVATDETEAAHVLVRLCTDGSYLITTPGTYIGHRLLRERSVKDALSELGESSPCLFFRNGPRPICVSPVLSRYADGAERFLDASGVWTREELLRRLAQEYQYDAYALVPWEDVALARVRIPFDASIAQSIGISLAQALGSFIPAYVFPMPDLLAT